MILPPSLTSLWTGSQHHRHYLRCALRDLPTLANLDTDIVRKSELKPYPQKLKSLALSLSLMATRVLLSLLVVCLVVEGSVGVTFTSKLIHRFSDEAKAVWVSRDGNASTRLWPEQSSMEFYGLLLANDLKRQKMKLGSQYQLLFPSEGSQTLFFGNEFDWLHYTWIDIGTPNVSFLVALDAGSDLLWVPCDCIQCAPLSASYYNMLDRDLSEYSPSISRTSKHLSCSHQLCELGPNCKSPTEPCPYKASYYTENTSSSGFLIEDKLHLASASNDTTQHFVQASVIIGCGRKQSGGYLDGAAPDGLMGLGLGEISVPSMLAGAGLVRNSFSLCFDENSSGRISFGDKGLAIQQYTPFLPLEGKYITYLVGVDNYCVGNSCLKQTGFQALVDSGTSFTFLPREVFNKVVLEIEKQANATRFSPDGDSLKYCYNASSQESLNIPSMKLVFSKNQSFIIRNPIYSIPVKRGFTLFCLGIQAIDGDIGVIGQNFMTGYLMLFDRDNLKLGWSHSRCQDLSDSTRVHLTPPPNDGPPNPLPTNEQESTPNNHTVAPAVAKRAPSKPSAASPLHFLSWQCLVSLLLVLI